MEWPLQKQLFSQLSLSSIFIQTSMALSLQLTLKGNMVNYNVLNLWTLQLILHKLFIFSFKYWYMIRYSEQWHLIVVFTIIITQYKIPYDIVEFHLKFKSRTWFCYVFGVHLARSVGPNSLGCLKKHDVHSNNCTGNSFRVWHVFSLIGAACHGSGIGTFHYSVKDNPDKVNLFSVKCV